MATVSYNGQSPWGSNPPYVNARFTPINYGTLWGNVRTISIQGFAAQSIVGNLQTFKDAVISTFSTNGGTLSVDGQSWDNAFVETVSFPKQSFFGKLEYNATLKFYDFDTYEIHEPKDDIEVQVEGSKIVSVTHAVSAKGVDGSTIGFDNARSFVQARVASLPNIPTWTLSNYILVEEGESLDRITSSYGIVKKYRLDPIGSAPQGIMLRYQTDITESITADYKNVEITGEYTGGKSTSIGTIQGGVVTESSLHALAQTASGLSLNSTAIGINVDQSENEKKITFKASFNDNQLFSGANFFFDYDVNVNEDSITGITKVTIDGEVKTQGGLSQRQTEINAFLGTVNPKTYLFGFASTGYTDIAGAPYTLNPEPESITVTKNEAKATLKLSATFEDEDFINGYSDANWDAKVSTSIPYIRSAPSATVNGHWTHQDFGFLTRETVLASANSTLIEGGTLGTPNMKAQNKSLMDDVFASYKGGGTPYTVTSGNTSNETETSSGSISEERSYDAGTALISV